MYLLLANMEHQTGIRFHFKSSCFHTYKVYKSSFHHIIICANKLLDGISFSLGPCSMPAIEKCMSFLLEKKALEKKIKKLSFQAKYGLF